MVNILGYPLSLPVGLEFLAEPGWAFILNLAATLLVLLLVNFVLLRVLKFITRRLPGDLEDIVLGIISRPLLILLGLYGVDIAFQQLPLSPQTQQFIATLTLTVVVMLVTHLLGRFIQDILVYYGEKWASRTETRVDDVLIPVLNLFGPLLLGIIAALIILPLWGVNVTSVLLGAGVLGLVLGLALQETLGNIFSGLSLLIESPFRKGDLIQLPDGRVSEVLHLGMRSTMLFSLAEQATIYLPNKTLASSMLVNLTKPNPEQRYTIDLSVGQGVDLAEVQHTLLNIANGHPAVLSSDMTKKREHVQAQVEHIRQQANHLPQAEAAAQALLAEADKNERSIPRLELDGQFNTQLLALKETLRNLIRGINTREVNGLSTAERQELYCNFVSPAENAIQATVEHAQAWVKVRDPWVNDTDFWNLQKNWEKRGEQLLLQWERLKKILYAADDSRETRLDDATKQMLEWLEREYKLPPGYWKNPSVSITALDGANTRLQLHYYVDNIRLEHDGRPARVRTELSRMIHEQMVENGVWG